MVQGQVLLKKGGRTETFLNYFFKSLAFLHLQITLPFAKLCYVFEKKNIIFCHHNFMKKGHSMLSKNEPEKTP